MTTVDLTTPIKMANGRHQLIVEDDLIPKGTKLTQQEIDDLNLAVQDWDMSRKKPIIDYINSYIKQTVSERAMTVKDVLRTAINLAPKGTKHDLFVLNSILNKVTEEADTVDFTVKETLLLINALHTIPDEALHPLVISQVYAALDPNGSLLPEGEINTKPPQAV